MFAGVSSGSVGSDLLRNGTLNGTLGEAWAGRSVASHATTPFRMARHPRRGPKVRAPDACCASRTSTRPSAIVAALVATVVGMSSRWQPTTMATATAQAPRSRRTADACQVRAREAERDLPVGVRRPTRYAARPWIGCCPLMPCELARSGGATFARTSRRAASTWCRSCPSSSRMRMRRSRPAVARADGSRCGSARPMHRSSTPGARRCVRCGSPLCSPGASR